MRSVKPTLTVVGTTAVAVTTVVVLMQRQFRSMRRLFREVLKIERAQLEYLADEGGPDNTGPRPILRIVK